MRSLIGKLTVGLLGIGVMVAMSTGIASAQGTLFVEGNNVGIGGTPGPSGNLQIFGASNADVFNSVGPNAVGNALNFGYSGSSFGLASGFFNVRPHGSAVAPNPAIYFATGNTVRMVLDNQGYIGIQTTAKFNPAHPIHANGSGAHLTASGVWTNASSRELKENVHPLDLQDALRALESLEPVNYNYKIDRDDPQVGFIAEEVPDLVATPDRRTLAHGEIVAVLTRVVKEQQSMIESLSAQVEGLREARASSSE